MKEKADEIIAKASADTDVAKARAIYEWVVVNTFRNPKTRGCGTGDIRFMLETGDLSGKCADLNALYVGLARAAGLPARDVYGIRVAKSDLGYKSLGPATENISKAQHCRADVYLSSYGWVPVDPADVRKVVLEEPPGNRPLSDELIKKTRARLFGSWEMNWMAYNFAHDVALPRSTGAPVGFLMYPQAETNAGRLDSLDPDNFKYGDHRDRIRFRKRMKVVQKKTTSLVKKTRLPFIKTRRPSTALEGDISGVVFEVDWSAGLLAEKASDVQRSSLLVFRRYLIPPTRPNPLRWELAPGFPPRSIGAFRRLLLLPSGSR